MRLKLLKHSWLLLLLGLSGCEFVRQYQLGDAVAKIGESVLYQTDIDRVTAGVLTAEDSARVVDDYIRQWATDELFYERATKQLSNKEQLDTLVESYRRSLYVRQYEEQLIAEKMSKTIDNDTLLSFYETYPERFVLRESLYKGLLVIVPNDVPDQARLKTAMTHLGDDNMEEIEKYVYQYAAGYEFFTEQWQPLYRLLLRLPSTTTTGANIQETLISRHTASNELLQFGDSTTTYYLRLTNRRLQGERMPYEYAEPEIQRILLQERQTQFLRQQKQEIYESALRTGKLIVTSEE